MISKNEFDQDLKPKDREVSFGIFMLRDLGVKTESNKKVKFKFLHANQCKIIPALSYLQLFTCTKLNVYITKPCKHMENIN